MKKNAPVNSTRASACANLRRDKSAFALPFYRAAARRRPTYGSTVAGVASACSVNLSFVTGHVAVCDGKCDGLGLRKCLNDKICDGVTAQNPGGYGATRYSRHPFRVFRVFRGQLLLLVKVEKTRISPKTWYWAIFQIGKFELAANQDIPAEIGQNQSLKFLQFLENFFGGDIYRGGGSGELGVQSAEFRIQDGAVRKPSPIPCRRLLCGVAALAALRWIPVLPSHSVAVSSSDVEKD